LAAGPAAATGASPAIRIVLADDHPLFRESIARVLSEREGFEVVAMAANASEAIVAAGRFHPDIALLDVTALTLGIETAGGLMLPLIRRNTTIPVTATEVFTTAVDGQTSVAIHVVQGERAFARDNASIGRFHLAGIPAAPRGRNRIKVTFSIDADGVVHAAARDLATGAERSIILREGAIVPEEQASAALEDYRRNESADRSRRERVALEVAGRAKLAVVGGMLDRAGIVVSEEDRGRIEEAASNLQRSLSGRSADDIRAAADDLDCAVFEASQKIGASSEMPRDTEKERAT
jgi:molecular chaperone DnaK